MYSLCVVGLDRFEQDPDDGVVGRDVVGKIVRQRTIFLGVAIVDVRLRTCTPR